MTHAHTNTPHKTRTQSDTRTSTETHATTTNDLCFFLEVFTHVSQNVFSGVGAFSFSLFFVPLRLGATSSVSRDFSHMTDEETFVF